MSEHIHFIGIGGISMSTLAAIAHKEGNTVTGSDRAQSDLTQHLEESGIKVSVPQAAENVRGADRVVYTAAISDDNPELLEAKRLALPLLRRAQYLGEIMMKYPVRIGVSGTHGKSSTTGMLGAIFENAGADPTVACGALLSSCNSAYLLGKGEHFIYEACEYKDSFLDFHPSVALLLNIEMDHVDYFHSMEQMKDSYYRSTLEAGAVVANFDDERVREVCEKINGAWVVKVGINREDLDYRALNCRLEGGYASFDLMKENECLGKVCLHVPGQHLIIDALSAAATAHICGIDEDAIIAGLASYKGIKRRFEYIGEYDGARIFDDYAHHPTEIAVTLSTCAEMQKGKGRVICLFQPHTYSRTAGLFDRFVSSLSLADKLFLLPIYAAREINTYGVSSDQLSQKIAQSEVVADFDEALDRIKKELRQGDMLITMGAGQANIVAQRLIQNV